MKLGRQVEYEPYEEIGCYTRVYIHGVMHILVQKLVAYNITTRIMFGLEAKIANNRILLNEIR